MMSLQIALQQKCIFPSSEWLDQFERNNSAISVNEQCEKAFQVIYHSDIKTLNPTSRLPREVHMFVSPVSINGNFLLQVESFRDISRPAYEHYLKHVAGYSLDNMQVKDGVGEESEIGYRGASVDKAKSYDVSKSRCLVMTLTDGTHCVRAIEESQLSNITTNNLHIGTKLLLKGPLQLRRDKTFLLQSNNQVEVLGGNLGISEEQTKRLEMMHLEEICKRAAMKQQGRVH